MVYIIEVFHKDELEGVSFRVQADQVESQMSDLLGQIGTQYPGSVAEVSKIDDVTTYRIHRGMGVLVDVSVYPEALTGTGY